MNYLPAATAAAMIFLTTPAMAQTMPVFDIETNCRSFGQECIDGEVTSRVYLQQTGWAEATPALRQKCISWEAMMHAKYAPERAVMMRYGTLEGCAGGMWEHTVGGYPK